MNTNDAQNADHPHQLAVRFTLSPELIRKVTDADTKDISDEECAQCAEIAREKFTSFLEGVQKRYRLDAIDGLEKKGVIRRFAEDVPALTDQLENILNSIRAVSAKQSDKPMLELSDADGAKLEMALSDCTLLCYRSWRMSDLKTDRELTSFMIRLYERLPLNENGVPKLTFANHQLLEPIIEDVFCLREVTDQHRAQNRIYELLDTIVKAAAGLLKGYGAREQAIEWLRLGELLEKRGERYTMSLSSENAMTAVSWLKADLQRLRLEIAYAAI